VNPELLPAFESTTRLGAFIRPLLLVWLLLGLWPGLARASLPLRQRGAVWSVVAAVLITRAVVVWTPAFELGGGSNRDCPSASSQVWISCWSPQP
jgi:hypothetical protein